MSTSIFEKHVIGLVPTNSYIFGSKDEAIFLDPGGDQASVLLKQLQEKGVTIKHILITHGHFDHLGYVDKILDEVDARLYLHEGEKPYFNEFLDWMTEYGLKRPQIPEPNVWLTDNQLLSISGLKIRVIHVPGHSPGSVIYNIEEPMLTESKAANNHKIAFVGDHVFQGSIGRVDLPHSNKDDMKRSLVKFMGIMKGDTVLFTGHGPDTSVKTEMENNPYLLAIQKGVNIF
jgi:glyoxylase-like metal-dependent hydrolase (beta-lactamase superfamily II)